MSLSCLICLYLITCILAQLYCHTYSKSPHTFSGRIHTTVYQAVFTLNAHSRQRPPTHCKADCSPLSRPAPHHFTSPLLWLCKTPLPTKISLPWGVDRYQHFHLFSIFYKCTVTRVIMGLLCVLWSIHNEECDRAEDKQSGDAIRDIPLINRILITDLFILSKDDLFTCLLITCSVVSHLTLWICKIYLAQVFKQICYYVCKLRII
jgi:hypothetical protein